MSNTTIKSIYSKLLQFDVDIEFKKSNNSVQTNQQQIQNRLYGFDHCKYGDKVYYDKTFGYNLIIGEYVGYCCVERGEKYKHPKFVYKENIGEFEWKNAIEKCKQIPNGYLPNRYELKLAYENGLKNELQDSLYWTSSQYDSDCAYFLDVIDGQVYDYRKVYTHLVRPFINVFAAKKQVNESINFDKSLLQFDDEIQFNKSKSDQVKKNLSNELEYIKWVDENFVDLGLPSGTLWAKNNLGVNLVNDNYRSWYGNYYMPFINIPVDFNNKEFKIQYNKCTNMMALFKKYGDKMPNEFNPMQNDPLYINKMVELPSMSDFQELLNNTDNEYIKGYLEIDNLNGLLLKSKINDNTLFFPCAGYLDTVSLTNEGTQCFYMSNTIGKLEPYSSEYGYYILKSFTDNWITVSPIIGSNMAVSIRPIMRI